MLKAKSAENTRLEVGAAIVSLEDEDMKGRGQERGSTLVEYALLVVIVSLTAVVAMKFCGQAVSERFTAVSLEIDRATGGDGYGGSAPGECELGEGHCGNGNGNTGFTGE